MKTTKYKVDTQAVCSHCLPAVEYSGQSSETVDTWARRHVIEHPGHIVTIHETHDVSTAEGRA